MLRVSMVFEGIYLQILSLNYQLEKSQLTAAYSRAGMVTTSSQSQ